MNIPPNLLPVLEKPDDVVQPIMTGADGKVLRSGIGEGASFTGKLPGTQDYVLALRASPDLAVYNLDVPIRSYAEISVIL